MDSPSRPSRSASRRIVESMEDGSMNERLKRRAVLALVLVVTMLGGLTPLGRGAGAQEATPGPEAQTWHVLVNNVSPEGKNWSFNTFYPGSLQAHPGDTIVFTLAPNPQAFHTVQILTAWRLA
jgi:plastocyanin